MKRPFLLGLLVLLLAGSLAVFGCEAPGEVANDEIDEAEPENDAVEDEAAPAPTPPERERSYEDGTYRGVFIDRDAVQVNVQFVLEDNIITDIGYRLLSHRDMDYLEPEDSATEALRDQHMQILEYLEGKDIRESLVDLYEPGDFVEDVDGFSGATIRANKVISAVRDGLNRGVYVY